MKKYHVWRTNSFKKNKPVHAFLKKQHSFKQHQTEINKNLSKFEAVSQRLNLRYLKTTFFFHPRFYYILMVIEKKQEGLLLKFQFTSILIGRKAKKPIKHAALQGKTKYSAEI